jgi:hypothetical protein
MKKSSLLSIAVMFLMVLSSCSSDENLLAEEQSTDLLKSYKVVRDATGAYSLDLNVEDNVSVGKFDNTVTNTNEFYLSLTDSKLKQSNSFNSDLLFTGDTFKVKFTGDNNTTRPSITVFDNNTKNAQKSGGIDSFLENYSITKNEDGSFDLDFTVKNEVDVDFVYNEKLSVHEIHLEEGAGNEKNFSRTLEKEDSELLKIDFVNHANNSGAKAAAAFTRKPKIIIDEE